MESKPGDGIDELALAIHEVSDPKGVIVQKDRRHPAFAQTQDLSLN